MPSSTYVLDFVKPVDDDETPPAEKVTPAYQISVVPSSPQAGQPFKIIIVSPQKFTLDWKHGGRDGSGTEPGEVHEEQINLGGNEAVEAAAPIDDLLGTWAYTALVDGNGSVYLAAGAYSSGFSARLARLNPPKPLWGTARVQYRAHAAQVWYFSGLPLPGEYMALAKCPMLSEPEKVIVQVVPADGSASGSPAVVTVIARDFCTDLPIPGADVWIDAAHMGTTDASGMLAVGLLSAGGHSIKISASGYQATDADDLNNDAFTL